MEKLAVGGIFKPMAEPGRLGRLFNKVMGRTSQGVERATLGTNRGIRGQQMHKATGAVLSDSQRSARARELMESRVKHKDLRTDVAAEYMTPEQLARVQRFGPQAKPGAMRMNARGNRQKAIDAHTRQQNAPKPQPTAPTAPAEAPGASATQTPNATPQTGGGLSPMQMGGMALGAAGVGGGAYALGNYQGNRNANTKRNVAFGTGVAAGLAAPTAIRSLGSYVNRLQNPASFGGQGGGYY